MADQELLIRINGTAKNFTDELDKAKKKTADLEKALSNTAKVSAAAFVGLAAAVGGTVARFSSFEKGFTNVVTLLDKGTGSVDDLQKRISGLRDGVLRVGAETGESFESLNKALFDLVSAGAEAGTEIAQLEAATKLATAGATTVDVAVKALSATFTSFGESAGTATQVAEKFFTAQKFGVTTVGELATEFNKVAGISKELGLSFDEALASLSSLTANGAKPTAQAATQLQRTLSGLILAQKDLSGESAAVQDALSLQNIKQRGLVQSLDLLKTAIGGDVVELQRLLGSNQAVQVALSLTGAQSELVAKQIDEIGNASKRAAIFQDALTVKQQTTEKALARLRTSIDAVAITFGELFAPAINAAASALTATAQALTRLDKTTLKILGLITSVALAVTGLVALVTTLGLAYIKVDRAIRLVNSTFKISQGIVAAYNFTITAGTKALRLFRAGMIAATTTVRGFAAATGIGLVIVALGLLITNFKETVAVAKGSFAALTKIVTNFASGVFTQLSGLGNVLAGAFTFDPDRVINGLKQLGEGIKKQTIDVGEGAAKAFSEAYNKSIEESEAAKIPAPEVEQPEQQQKQQQQETVQKTVIDTSGRDELVKKEQESAARLREIRQREADLAQAQFEANADKRVQLKDKELAAIQKEEQEAADLSLKIKQDQLDILKSIDALETENQELEAKKRRSAKEQVNLEANQRELEILQEQLGALNALETQNAELEVLEQEERNARKLERIREAGEEEAALKEELALLGEEQRDLLDEQDLEKFQNQILTKRELEEQNAAEQLQKNIERRNQFLRDEQKFGTNFAKIRQFFASEEVKLADQTAGQLVQLTQSKNNQLKAIGKAASLVQIGIKTAEGAIGAYSALAGIPIVGPALGIAAAAALTAFGAEQAAAVVSAQRGGIVPNGNGGSNDRIPAMLQPGELVVPQALAPDFIQAVGRPEVDPDDEGSSTNVVIGFTEDAIPFIEQKLLERRATGTGEL